MSNPQDRVEGKTITEATKPQSWRQRHGAALMFAVFALGAILMVMMQKKSVH